MDEWNDFLCFLSGLVPGLFAGWLLGRYFFLLDWLDKKIKALKDAEG